MGVGGAQSLYTQPPIALHSATDMIRPAQTGSNAVLQMLLDAGADPNSDNEGETPLHAASEVALHNLTEKGFQLRDFWERSVPHECFTITHEGHAV